jgi:hypothetical protein
MPSTSSWKLSASGNRRRRHAWSRTGSSCWPSTTTPPSTGCTYAPPTRSSPPLPRSACGPPRKGSGSRLACLTMVFKLAQAAERKWRKINGHALLGGVIQGVQFKDGIKADA